MAVCGVALMFGNTVSAQSSKDGIVTVVRIQGEARYSVGDNVWHPLIAGKILHSGAVIQSAADSSVDIVLGAVPVQVSYPNSAFPTPASLSSAADPNVRGYVVYNAKVSQNVIRMYGNTVLAINKLTSNNTGADVVGDTELDLRAGKIFGNVKKLSAMSEFEVKIPNGVAGIRGTEFTIEADGTVAVFSGSVIVDYSYVFDGKTINVGPITVGPGQEFTPVFNGQPAGQPTTLSADALNNLYDTAAAAGTLYNQSTSFVDNCTKIYVSPVRGASLPPT